jgi:flavin reductase (DIM6/NTAB) family NADH-FMN oxidoreductase RutF
MTDNKQRQLTEAFNKGIALGLYIVTVKAGDTINGMTAALVCRVSRNPPMVMVSIGETNYTNELIKKAKYFVVNTLTEGQQEMGKHFGFVSGREADKLMGVGFFEAESGAPILERAMSYLECELFDTLITGDHTLFIGKVIGGRILDRSKSPLVFQRSDFF